MAILRLIGFLIVAGAALGGGYYVYSNYFNVQTVTTRLASVAPVSEAIYGTGTVEPQRWAKVVPLDRRRLIELCSCEGQYVRAGQVLGRQDDAAERSALHELEVSNDQAQRDLKRAEQDRTKGDAEQREYEQRWTEFEQSKARIAEQKVRIDSLVLRAPLDGMVLRRDGEVGEIAGPTDVLFWVGPPTPVQVVAEVNEEEINRIVGGQKAFLRSEAFPGQALRATVAQITPKGDPSRKTFRVYLLLPNDTPLRIGMSVEVNIIFREKPSAIVVPAEAVAGNLVQIVRKGAVTRVPIQVGVRGSRNVEIIGNISDGTAVLSPARMDLADGTKVRVDGSAIKLANASDDLPPPDQVSRDTTPDSPPPVATPRAPPPLLAPPSSVSAPPPSVAAPPPSVAPPPQIATANSTANNDDAMIAAAMTAHIESVVNDARRRFGVNR
jgi:RND family efflux transporter MFP subunit